MGDSNGISGLHSASKSVGGGLGTGDSSGSTGVQTLCSEGIELSVVSMLASSSSRYSSSILVLCFLLGCKLDWCTGQWWRRPLYGVVGKWCESWQLAHTERDAKL